MGQQPPSELSIEELLQRAREGDEEALEELFRRCRPTLEAWAQKRASQEQPGSARPSDIYQEAAMQAFKHFSKFQGTTKGEWFAWLKSIVFTRAEQHLRDERRQKRGISGALPLDTDEAEAVTAQQRSPSQLTSTQQGWHQVLKHLSQLPADQSNAMWLFYKKELRVAEVARQLGKTETAVASLLQRGIKALRQRMAGEASPQVDAPSPVDAAFLAYLKLREAGKTVDLEAFVAEYPDCADELRNMLEWIERLQTILPDPSSS